MMLPLRPARVEARLPERGATACGWRFALAAGRRCELSRRISLLPGIPPAKTSIRALDPS